MAERYFPFDAGAGANARELEWAQMAKNFIADGVGPNVSNTNPSLGYSTPSGFTSRIAAGEASVRGFKYINDAPLNLVHDSISSGGVLRNDLIALILDRAANTLTLGIIKGTDEINGADPALTQSDDIGVWQMPLWRVPIQAGTSSINAAQVVDLRTTSDGNSYSCVSTYKPAAVHGRRIFCRDTKRAHYADASGRWKPGGIETLQTKIGYRDYYGVALPSINPGGTFDAWTETITLTEWGRLEVESEVEFYYPASTPIAGFHSILVNGTATPDTAGGGRWHNLARSGIDKSNQRSANLYAPGNYTLRGRIYISADSTNPVQVFLNNYRIREVG